MARKLLRDTRAWKVPYKLGACWVCDLIRRVLGPPSHQAHRGVMKASCFLWSVFVSATLSKPCKEMSRKNNRKSRFPNELVLLHTLTSERRSTKPGLIAICIIHDRPSKSSLHMMQIRDACLYSEGDSKHKAFTFLPCVAGHPASFAVVLSLRRSPSRSLPGFGDSAQSRAPFRNFKNSGRVKCTLFSRCIW